MASKLRELDIEPVVPPQAIELAARHLGAPGEKLALTKLAGDASSRAYFRAEPGENSNASSVIIAIYPGVFDTSESAASRLSRYESSDPALRLTFANDPCAHLEVTALFLEAGLPVPRIIGVMGSAGLMLIEEVGDCKLQD